MAIYGSQVSGNRSWLIDSYIRYLWVTLGRSYIVTIFAVFAIVLTLPISNQLHKKKTYCVATGPPLAMHVKHIVSMGIHLRVKISSYLKRAAERAGRAYAPNTFVAIIAFRLYRQTIHVGLAESNSNKKRPRRMKKSENYTHMTTRGMYKNGDLLVMLITEKRDNATRWNLRHNSFLL